jgi:vacuolar protein sorting-associated protein 13A/C
MGSIDLIGNPVALFSNIGRGMQDLIQKPKEGFIKGPLEGGLGIVKGAGSLLGRTVSSTCSALEKITGSIGTGVAGLSMDEGFLKSRQYLKIRKARNVG